MPTTQREIRYRTTEELTRRRRFAEARATQAVARTPSPRSDPGRSSTRSCPPASGVRGCRPPRRRLPPGVRAIFPDRPERKRRKDAGGVHR